MTTPSLITTCHDRWQMPYKRWKERQQQHNTTYWVLCFLRTITISNLIRYTKAKNDHESITTTRVELRRHPNWQIAWKVIDQQMMNNWCTNALHVSVHMKHRLTMEYNPEFHSKKTVFSWFKNCLILSTPKCYSLMHFHLWNSSNTYSNESH